MWTLTGFADEIADDFAAQLALLDELNVGYVELRSAWGINVAQLDEDQLARVKTMLAGAGVKVSSIGSPIGKISITDEFEPHLELMRHVIGVAHLLDAKHIRVFSFFIPEGDDPVTHRDEVIRRMKALTQLAQEGDVTLLHENEKEIYGDIPERCVDVLESVSSPHLRAILDPANYVQCGVRPFDEAYPLIRPYLAYMHLKDAVANTPDVVPVGEGDGQVPEILHELKVSGFDGFFSIEPHLGDYTAFGAMSGPEQWTRAHRALVELITAEGVEYR